MNLTPTNELLNEKGELPHASSVGGYGITYVGAHFDDVLCLDCAKATAENVKGGFVHWEGASLTCDGCNAEIESEYGEEDE